MILLELRALKIAYGGINAVKGIDLVVHEGEMVALIGANGAGKTSILRAITGLRKIRSGEIRFRGQRIDGLAPDELVKMGIAMVPEGRRSFPLMSVKDNLLIGAFTRHDKAEVARTLEAVLARFPRLRERYGQAAGTMSGGEQQMLVIGRALMSHPTLLLLDEPSLGIAPKLVQSIARSIVAINRDERVSVLLVEQNSRIALKISARAYALSTGAVALSGRSAELLDDERVKTLYLGGEL